jgi:Amt family ammonium transporter
VPFLACTKLKAVFKYDDALDTFGVHGVGGTLGALLTGILANVDANANLKTNLASLVGNGLWLQQLAAIGVTVALSIGATAIIAYVVKAVIGLRPSVEVEESGLDDGDHGESGYHSDEGGHGGLASVDLPGAQVPSMALDAASGM